ncbi:MAG: hypothetical protein GXY83_37305 [Rhodopirellula sp.]|nr:hypothetical protein [Rhodopirellula sp.]
MIQGFYLPVTTALPPNDPPEFLTPSLGPMVKDCLFDFVLDVEDPNGHAIAGFEVVPELTTAPGFSSANIDASGHIQWTPTAGGPFEIAIRATDEHGAAETVTYPIYVVPNANPEIEAGAASPAFLGMAFAYSVTIADPNAGDELTVTLNDEATAAGLYLAHEADSDVWTLTWDEDDVGPVGAQVLIRIEVQDNHGGWSRMTLTLPVYDPDDPNAPQVLGPDGEIEIPAGREFHFQVAAQGAPGANLSFALEPCEPTLELPIGISIDRTGLITWTPTLEQAGAAGGEGIAYHLPETGTFTTLDSYFGNLSDPQSFHKYLFTPGDPINFNDPLGEYFGFLSSITIGLQRYGISAQNGLAVMGAMDRLQTIIDILQISLQLMMTGTVNPIDVAEVAFNLLPGSALLKGIKAVMPPLGPLTSITKKVTGSRLFLNSMAGNLPEIAEIYKNVDGSLTKAIAVSKRVAERIGEMGGGLVAQRLGLKPVAGFAKRYHGFDGVFKQGNKFFILEAKGGAGALATGQMGQKWITEHIKTLPKGLQKELNDAIADNRLFGIVTTTPIDKVAGEILDPEYTIKHFDQIGWGAW